jgi:hypothetical protein
MAPAKTTLRTPSTNARVPKMILIILSIERLVRAETCETAFWAETINCKNSVTSKPWESLLSEYPAGPAIICPRFGFVSFYKEFHCWRQVPKKGIYVRLREMKEKEKKYENDLPWCKVATQRSILSSRVLIGSPQSRKHVGGATQIVWWESPSLLISSEATIDSIILLSSS